MLATILLTVIEASKIICLNKNILSAVTSKLANDRTPLNLQ